MKENRRAALAMRMRALAIPAILAAPTLLFPAPVASAGEAGTVDVAQIPLPRLNPQRNYSDPLPATADPIAEFIAAADDEHRLVEDSDEPQAAFTPVAAAKRPAPVSKTDINTIGLRYAIKFLDDGDPSAATAAAYALPNPIDTKVIDWLVAVSGRDDVPASHIAEVWRKLANWPGQALLQIRYEQALVREKAPPQVVVQALAGRKPLTDDGTILLARSYLELGRKNDAANVVRTYWREERFGSDMENKLRKEFGSLLTSADYKVRTDRLLYEEQNSAALRNAKYLDKNQQLLAAAVAAVSTNKNAAGALAAVPAATRSDPLYTYAQIQYLRRADKLSEAAKLMLSAPRDPARIDGDAWWVERRVLSREVLDHGDAATAYKIAAGHSAEIPCLDRRGRIPCRLVCAGVPARPGNGEEALRGDPRRFRPAAQPVARRLLARARRRESRQPSRGDGRLPGRRPIPDSILRAACPVAAGGQAAADRAAAAAGCRHQSPLQVPRAGAGHSAPRRRQPW